MNANLAPVTLNLPDALMAALMLEGQKDGLTLQAWATILVKKAIRELSGDAGAPSNDLDPSATP